MRRSSGISFKDPETGEDPHSETARERSHKEKPLAIADVHFIGHVPPSLPDRMYLGPRGLFLFSRLSNKSEQKPIYRVAFKADPGTHEITKEVLQDAFQAGLDLPGNEAPQVESIIFSSTFHIRFAVADQLHKGVGGGVVALVGDAAHIHSPAGGQGMNLGIRDAIDLGRILANIRSDSSNATTAASALEALERYSVDRRPLALQIIKMTRVLTRILLVENALLRGLRNIVVWTLGRLPGSGDRFALKLSGLQ